MSSAERFPGFKSTASDQLGSRASDGFTAARLGLRRAFTPAQPITERAMFSGRTAMVADLIRAIEDERLHAIIHGQRGIGKTSLLHVLAQAAREARYLVVYISCGAATTFDETFRAVAANIPVLYHADYGATSPDAEKGATFADLLAEPSISARVASDLCAKVVGTRILVVLDEFDRCESIEFRRSIAEFLKNLSDRSIRVQMVIAGVAANLEELIEPGAMVQRGVVALEVPRMTSEEVGEMVRRGESISGVSFEPAALEALAVAANGLPYLASLLAQHAALTALSRPSLSVQPDDVREAIARALVEMKARAHRQDLIVVAGCERAGEHILLGRIAGLAQAAHGAFSLDGVAGLFADPTEAERAKALVERLAQAGRLIEGHEDEVGNQFRFIDQNLLPYLWLQAAQADLTQVDAGACGDAPVAGTGAAC